MGLRWRAGAVRVAAAAVVSMAWARPAAAQRPIKRVLTLHAGAEAFPGNTRFDELVTKVLYSHPTIEVDYYAEFLEYEEPEAKVSVYSAMNERDVQQRAFEVGASAFVVKGTGDLLSTIKRLCDDRG